MLRLVVLGTLAAVVVGQTTQVSQCTQDSGPLPINAHIGGCVTPPCSLPQQQNAVINITFRTPRTTLRMTTLAVAYLSVLGLPVPIQYPLGENAVTCNFLQNSYCPVLGGEVLQYTLLMYIEDAFPAGISPTIEFRIEDDNSESIMCIRVPITIVGSTTSPNATIADTN